LRAQYETTEKIKKLLSDTIEFSQKTALAAKRAMQGTQDSELDENLSLAEDKSSRSGTGKHPVIRNLIGATDKKSSMSSPDHHKGQAGGPQFMNVVEHRDEDLDESSSDDCL